MWIRPGISPDRTKYYEMVLCYVDDVLVLSHAPMQTIEGINAIFKLKGDKTEEPSVYLGASLHKVLTASDITCWAMSS